MSGSHVLFDGRKKAQTELLGFAVVILIIAIGLMFVIGFYVTNPETDFRTTYLNQQVATNMNDVILETTTTCRQMLVKDLLKQCINNENEVICPATDAPDPLVMDATPSKTACDYLHDVFLPNRFEQTLDKWGFDYKYSIRFDSVTSQELVLSSILTNMGSRNTYSCEVQRSALSIPGAVRPAIVYMDIFSCPRR